jgi:hypothetical protein
MDVVAKQVINEIQCSVNKHLNEAHLKRRGAIDDIRWGECRAAAYGRHDNTATFNSDALNSIQACYV